MSTWFYGDPHSEWRPLLRAAADGTIASGDTLVLMGDYDLDRPLRDVVAPVLAAGVCVRWILGNHDTDTTASCDHVTGWTDADLGGRVHRTSTGMAVAGLSGIFKGKVWYPRDAEKPVHETRAAYVRTLKTCERWRRGVPLRQRDAVFPEDAEALGRRRADVLACHEAPTSHPHGFAGIDRLAAALGVRWVIHGHHHTSYEGRLPDGVRVRGLGRAELWRLPE